MLEDRAETTAHPIQEAFFFSTERENRATQETWIHLFADCRFVKTIWDAVATWAAFPISGGLVDHISATTFKRWKRFAKPHHVGDLGDLA